MNKNIVKYSLPFLLIMLLNFVASAQETEVNTQIRTSLELSYKPVKKLKLSLKPELRYDENMTVDEYLMEAEIAYKLWKFISVGGTYRFVGNVRDNKDTEYLNRFALNTTFKKKIDRFSTSFRLQYTDFADDEESDKEYLRYKASLKYDIRNVKITPIVAVEAFQTLDGGGLHKMRYTFGFDYKLFKKNFIGISYKLDDFNSEEKVRHILSFGYKLGF
ncbi:DUF2490 domain-containing protein [Flammeovirgaceae bacterium SG7u.111]|nr:DUF2490 domain-containing protein [Flammeovirgaceae bacterium SG7u.132]WPO37177.1 DUF2490 domain-containing protein [Flammeovirgaceae bacterium SG7u.111]